MHGFAESRALAEAAASSLGPVERIDNASWKVRETIDTISGKRYKKYRVHRKPVCPRAANTKPSIESDSSIAVLSQMVRPYVDSEIVRSQSRLALIEANLLHLASLPETAKTDEVRLIETGLQHKKVQLEEYLKVFCTPLLEYPK